MDRNDKIKLDNNVRDNHSGGDLMDDRCIFCGTELGILQRKKLSCGNTTQILCKDCYPKYEPLSAVERAEDVMDECWIMVR